MPSLNERYLTCAWCSKERPLGGDYKLFGRSTGNARTIYLCSEKCRDAYYENRGWSSVLDKPRKEKE
jgi:ribosomal protein L24E